MSPSWQDLIQIIANGEDVDAAVTNRPLLSIINNLRYLKGLLAAGQGATAIIDPSVAVQSTVVAGTPVWWNNTNARYEPAQAQAVLDLASGALVASPQTAVAGVCLNKLTTTTGDILLAGKAALDITAVLAGVETLTAGRYFLSASTAGKLTATRPPITVGVLTADGRGNVIVLPQVRDFFLGDHVHYSFDLTARPAGDAVPPALGSIHAVLNPDVAVKGWLPANHASFNGLAPTGALFGYNIAADTALQAVWPPIPLSAYSILVTKYNPQDALQESALTVSLDFVDITPAGIQGAQGAQGSILGAQGVQGVLFGPQGVTDDGTGLETSTADIAYPCAEIGDLVFAAPLTEPGQDLLWNAYVKTNGYVTVRLGSTLSQTLTAPPRDWVVRLVKPASSGCGTGVTHAPINPVGLITIDANGIWWMTNCYGDCPWPTTLNTLLVGPAGSTDVCPRADGMAITLSFAKLSFGTGSVLVTNLAPSAGSPITVKNLSGVNANAGNLQLGLNLQQELDLRIVQLTGVDESNVPGFHYWRFPAGQVSSLRGQFVVPTLYLGASPTIQPRLRLYGTATGTLGQLSCTYRRVPRPTSTGTVATPPAVDTVTTITTSYPLQAGQIFEAVGSAIPVATGDVVVFTFTRNIGDGYAGDIGLISATGAVAGS